MPQYPCLLALGLLVLLARGAHTQRGEDDLKSLIHDTDVNDRATSPDDEDFEVEFVYPKKGGGVSAVALSSSPVRRVWGVPDTETHVGKVFSYPIPDDAFEGQVASYNFEDLPPWLSFSSGRRVLEGIPGPRDVGPHYITVYAKGNDGSTAKDAFAVQVSTVPASTALKESMCSSKQDLTIMTIVLDASFMTIRPRDRVRIAQTLSTMFMVKLKKISLVSPESNVDPLSEDAAIMGGPGKLRPNHYYESSQKDKRLQAQWSIGCDGEIHKEDRSMVENLAQSAKSGKLEDALGIPVVGWVVTQVNPSSKRVRRDADYSGDDYLENDYEYDYDEDYFNLNNVLDRSVPSLATPVFPDTVYATAYPAGGDPHHPVSPVLRPVPLSTPAYVPVKPTRVVVEASPTLVYKTDYPYGRVDPQLDSSLLTHPTTSADYTTPLTSSTSSVRTGPTRGGPVPIDVTSVPEAGETTEYGVRTFPPRVISHIAKIPWDGGFVQRYRIPEKTFKDFEDGGTRNLSLSLVDEEGFAFTRDSWIQFEPLKQEVYALPLREHVGKYKFKLIATDKDTKSAEDELVINVSQHKQDRIYNHEFTFDLKIEKKYEYEFAYSLDWQVKAIEKIAALFGDSIHNIKVQKISRNPLQISWTNMTLTDSSSTACPTEELEAIAEVMLSGHGSEPSKVAKKVFLPEFHLKRIHTRFLMSCEEHMYHERHHSHGETNARPHTPVEGARGRSESDLNYPPVLNNQIDQLNASVGRLFKYKVSEDFCYDHADGNTRKMELRFLTNDFTAPPEDLWLKFDPSNQEFLGLPLPKDATTNDEIYQLVCIDSLGKRISDALVVTVKNDTYSLPKPVIFSLTIEKDYEAFMSNVYDKTRLLEELGQAFGDSGAEYIGVRSLTKGSVKLEWFNTTLPNDPCPYEAVKRLRSIMMDENGKVHESFKEKFEKYFVISDAADIYPSSSCLAGDTPTHPERHHPVASVEEEEVVPPRDEDYLLTFVVPAVIIAAMLLLAALVACCLYRRRRYGKMSMAGDRTFVSKGIPIIFAEELDDHHRPDSAKSPVIMKEEKPPLPPPEYQRNSPPRNERQQQQQQHQQQQQRPPSGGDANSSDDTPYHRPPPFTASNGGSRNQRPNLPPAYRKTPTYVPP